MGVTLQMNFLVERNNYSMDLDCYGDLSRWLSGLVLGVLGIARCTVTGRLWCVVSSPLILGFVPRSVGALLGLSVILSVTNMSHPPGHERFPDHGRGPEYSVCIHFLCDVQIAVPNSLL